MSVTYGFYNSLNGDRKYDAIQMSSIFDGVINDGIYATIGTAMMVTASNPTSMIVNVGIGRAWFNHTWTLNDSILPIEIPESEIILNRIDAIVLEVNASDDYRENTIKVVKGTPSSTPANPTMIHTTEVNQYPLAYVYVGKGVTTISASNITNVVGTSTTPFVTGIIETVSIDALLAKWEDEWNKSMESNEDEWTTWFSTFTSQNTTAMSKWESDTKNEFDDWYASLVDTLDGDVAANLAQQILTLQSRVEYLEACCKSISEDKMIVYSLQDSDEDDLIDSDGNKMEGRAILVI